VLPPQETTVNHYGRDITGYLPSAYVGGPVAFDAHHRRIWRLAEPHLKVRDNDVHTLYAYGIARALTALHPECDPEVVLPAVLLHDTGWSCVPEEEILQAIAPDAGRPDLVLLHEKEGARIAADVLTEVGHDPDRIDEILAIIDGHDSRKTALSLNDALMKDADKLWRLTPHGVETVMAWFGLSREQAHLLIDSRLHPYLLTDAGRTMAAMLAAITWVDTTPERVALG
jgi:HD superfamily phosphodiesterase